MQFHIHARTHIRASAELVYDYLENLEHLPHWLPLVKSVRSADELPHGVVGKTYQQCVYVPLKGYQVSAIEVLETTDQASLLLHAQIAQDDWLAEFRVRAGAECTEVQVNIVIERPTSPIRQWLLPLLQTRMQKRVARAVERLRMTLEWQALSVAVTQAPSELVALLR